MKPALTIAALAAAVLVVNLGAWAVAGRDSALLLGTDFFGVMSPSGLLAEPFDSLSVGRASVTGSGVGPSAFSTGTQASLLREIVVKSVADVASYSDDVPGKRREGEHIFVVGVSRDVPLYARVETALGVDEYVADVDYSYLYFFGWRRWRLEGSGQS